MIQSKKRQMTGFTIIELMLAMTFVTLLLLAIAGLTIHIGSLYNKGLTLKYVNESGGAISRDLQTTIASAPPFNADDSGDTEQYKNVPDRGGRLCLGTYSYAWNYPKALSGDPSYPLYTEFKIPGGGGVIPKIRFIKTRDPSSSLCTNPATAALDYGEPVELLSEGERELAITKFAIIEAARDGVSGQSLYAVDFSVGTANGSKFDVTGSECAPPSTTEQYEDFCGVNKFSVVVRANGLTGGAN